MRNKKYVKGREAKKQKGRSKNVVNCSVLTVELRVSIGRDDRSSWIVKVEVAVG